MLLLLPVYTDYAGFLGDVAAPSQKHVFEVILCDSHRPRTTRQFARQQWSWLFGEMWKIMQVLLSTCPQGREKGVLRARRFPR